MSPTSRGQPAASSGRPTRALEQLFLTMHARKLDRDLNGPQKKKTRFHFVALACLLVLMYGLSAYEYGNESLVAITLTLGQMVLIAVWVFTSILVTSILGNSKLYLLLCWMIIYWPLLAVLASLLFSRAAGGGGDETWIVYMLVSAEIATLLCFVVIYYLYPKLVATDWFREKYGATRNWRITLLDDRCTMEYDGMWGRFSRRRYRCRYDGETNSEGLPHGKGVWSDDIYNGEVLSGMWKDGKPVAPFHSRQYGGKGNTFKAVSLAYFKANDDTFEANKLVPTNDGAPTSGTVAVECSVAGEFMSHLPEASMISGLEEGDSMTIGECCRSLDSGTEPLDNAVTELHISSGDPRGVQIGGHVFTPTSLPFTRRAKQVIIDIIPGAEYSMLDAAADDGVDKNDEETGMQAGADEDEEAQKHMTEKSMISSAENPIRLEVKNWTRIDKKDALIFLPGFNSNLKHSCECFGQMLAMTSLCQRVYPVIFAWPGGLVPTYRYASFIAASENNRKHFLQMLKGLQSEGIQNIHIVSHSLGVQTLMSVFEDNDDGSPSPVSQCFGPATTYGNNVVSSVSKLGKLVCRSITMLNPDFPVHPFRERSFWSIRRVTTLITVVGDSNDQALFWSSFINGMFSFLGHPPSTVLESKARQQEKGFHLQRAIGRDIDSLYALGEADIGSDKSEMLFQSRGRAQNEASVVGSRKEEPNAVTKAWLDCDVIDTTGLDTNVNDLRHSAFAVNSILLRDIEEIVMTGKRAIDRKALLHIKGNVFEYCHAPSFVSY